MVAVWSEHQLQFVSFQSQQYDLISLEEYVNFGIRKFKVELSVEPDFNLAGQIVSMWNDPRYCYTTWRTFSVEFFQQI